MKTVIVRSSPWLEDQGEDAPPWAYSPENFCLWVDEVFLEGYKGSDPLPELGDAIATVIDCGYVVEVVDV